MATSGLISFLIFCLVLAIVAGIVYWILTLIPLPEPFKKIALVAFVLIILLIILSRALPLLGVAI